MKLIVEEGGVHCLLYCSWSYRTMVISYVDEVYTKKCLYRFSSLKLVLTFVKWLFSLFWWAAQAIFWTCHQLVWLLFVHVASTCSGQTSTQNPGTCCCSHDNTRRKSLSRRLSRRSNSCQLRRWILRFVSTIWYCLFLISNVSVWYWVQVILRCCNSLCSCSPYICQDVVWILMVNVYRLCQCSYITLI